MNHSFQFGCLSRDMARWTSRKISNRFMVTYYRTQQKIENLHNLPRYNIAFFVLTYCIPLLIMLFCYIQMGKVCFLEKYFSGVIFSSKVLWVKKSVGEENVTTQKSMKTKQKIVKMFGAVTLIFAICWLPYHVYFIYSYFFPEIMKVIWSTKWTLCTNFVLFL